MIIVRLMGGLGNQMFQYATARRLALWHGAELALDTGYFNQVPPGDTPRYYELDRLRIQARLASTSEIAALSGRCRNNWLAAGIYLRRLVGLTHSRPHLVRERPGEFCTEVLTLPDNVYLDGYWHSERYFSDFSEVIRNELTVTAPLAGRNLALAAEISRVEAVALHVRRGDYVSSAKTAAFHGSLSVSYYYRAVDELGRRVDNPHLFVFSDDPDWVRHELKFPVPTTLVDHNPPGRGYEDQRLMSLCRHAIIANSSFSWWGGWLIDNPGKVVIAPQFWFNDPARQSPELLPAGWLQVAND